MATYAHTRRAMLGAIAIAPVMLSVPASAAPSPFRQAENAYRAAVSRFNAIPHDLELTNPDLYDIEEGAFISAVRAVDAAPAATAQEFVDAFLIATDNGQSLITEEVLMKLIADAKRIKAAA